MGEVCGVGSRCGVRGWQRRGGDGKIGAWERSGLGLRRRGVGEWMFGVLRGRRRIVR